MLRSPESANSSRPSGRMAIWPNPAGSDTVPRTLDDEVTTSRIPSADET